MRDLGNGELVIAHEGSFAYSSVSGGAYLQVFLSYLSFASWAGLLVIVELLVKRNGRN